MPTIADGKNNITKAGNFEFKIPEKFYYDRNNEGLLVYDGKANWRIYIRADQGRYEDLAKAKKSVKETLIESSVSVNEIKETKKDKRSILVIEGTTKNDNRLIAFSDATHDYIFYIEIVDATNNYDYEALDVAIDIINNATYKESPSKLEDKTVYDISEIVIRASEEYKALTKK